MDGIYCVAEVGRNSVAFNHSGSLDRAMLNAIPVVITAVPYVTAQNLREWCHEHQRLLCTHSLPRDGRVDMQVEPPGNIVVEKNATTSVFNYKSMRRGTMAIRIVQLQDALEPTLEIVV